MKKPLSQIHPIAIELWENIKPHCAKAKIAGSIRRQCSIVGDIEIVCTPTDRSGRNKIGLILMQNGSIRKGSMTGRYVQAFYKGCKLDLFMPQPFDFYRIFAIRTGSAEYAKKIAYAWQEKGYQGTVNGLQEVSKRGHMLQPPTWESEKHFFEWLGMEWVEPKNR